jgi:hypothetical protein
MYKLAFIAPLALVSLFAASCNRNSGTTVAEPAKDYRDSLATILKHLPHTYIGTWARVYCPPGSSITYYDTVRDYEMNLYLNLDTVNHRFNNGHCSLTEDSTTISYATFHYWPGYPIDNITYFKANDSIAITTFLYSNFYYTFNGLKK